MTSRNDGQDVRASHTARVEPKAKQRELGGRLSRSEGAVPPVANRGTVDSFNLRRANSTEEPDPNSSRPVTAAATRSNETADNPSDVLLDLTVRGDGKTVVSAVLSHLHLN